jgi:hypothetical protein
VNALQLLRCAYILTLLYTQYVGDSIVTAKQIILNILTGLHILSYPDYEEMAFGIPSLSHACMYVCIYICMCVYVYMYVCMYMYLIGVLIFEQILFMFSIQEFVHS